MLASRIIGIGGYLPTRKMTNFDLEKLLDTTDEWIQQRSGIQVRYWVEPHVATSDLALEASKMAIEKAGIDKSEIDLVILATSSADTYIPGGAAFLQAKLEIGTVPYFDIRQGCSGFVYGLSLADQFIKTGKYKTVLLACAEVQSKGLDRTPNGRNVSVLFGDGAGAVVLRATDVKDPLVDPHVMVTTLHSDGHFGKELMLGAEGSAFGENLIDEELIKQGAHYPQMNGRLVFTHAVTRMPEVLLESCHAAGVDLHDIKYLFFHQANLRINQKVAEILKVKDDVVYNTIHKFGNTTAATIPLGLFDAQEHDLLKPGQLIGAASFGAGFTWASAIWRL